VELRKRRAHLACEFDMRQKTPLGSSTDFIPLEHVAATDQEMGRAAKMQEWFAVGTNRRQSWTTSNLAKTKQNDVPREIQEVAITTSNGEPRRDFISG